MIRLRALFFQRDRFAVPGSNEGLRHTPALVLQKSGNRENGKPGGDHSPTQNRSPQPTVPHRKWQTGSLNRDRGRQSQHQNVAAIMATGQVFRHHGPFGFRQSTLGESRE
jgi:hypothetical protein